MTEQVTALNKHLTVIRSTNSSVVLPLHSTYRKHPVTGRISPHNGTDFATPVGSPVYSTGDGKVIAVRNHPYAGKYLVIEHNSVYKTRYLHLSRFLVKKGDHVKRGQKIALSGATGRLTGPHLHFEVLVRNRAVDAMKADLPLASSISTKDKPAFLARVSEFDDLVAREQSASSAQQCRTNNPLSGIAASRQAFSLAFLFLAN